MRPRQSATPALRARFFRSRAEFRRWLQARHRRREALWVGFHRRSSGQPSLTWEEAVEEALCFGWIDGLRRRLDASRYVVRFTPRRAGSIWSAVNIAKVEALIAARRMRVAGRRAYAARRHSRSGNYSYEQRPHELPEPYAGMLRGAAAAAHFFAAQTASYRRAATWWVISARQEVTRLRRANALIEHSRHERLIPQFLRRPKQPPSPP